MKYRESPRALRKLIRRVLDARSGDNAATRALAAHLQDRPQDRATADDLDRLWVSIGRLPAPELRLAPALARPSLGHRLRNSFHWSLPVTLAAAAVALLVLVPLVIRAAPAALDVQHYAAGSGRRTLQLVDGSVVTLAPRSSLDVAFSDDHRDLRLASGEAFFQVAHETARPFVVATAHGKTRATGTAFAVQLDGEAATVTVAEGRIEISGIDGGQTRQAAAGQQVRYALDPAGTLTAIGAATATQDRNALGWRNGMLAFEGEPLATVVSQVNRYSPRPITIIDPALATLPIFATIKIDSPDGLLAIVAAQARLGPTQLRRALRVDGVG